MRFLFLFFILFPLTSCLTELKSGDRFHGNRTKLTSSVERQRPKRKPKAKEESKQPEEQSPQADPVQGESMVFPFVFNDAHVKIHLQPQEEQKKMLISVEPEETPVPVIAGFNGSVSITEKEDVYVLSVSPKTGKQVLFFELDKEHTELLVEDSAIVTKKTSVAESSKPILFYVKRDEQLTRLCFSIEQLSTGISVVQDYEDHPDCK